MEVYGVSLEPALNFLKVWHDLLNTVPMDDCGTVRFGFVSISRNRK